MYYPLRFTTIYKETVWGGRSLALLGKSLPKSDNIAESWEISAHPSGVSIISNGVMAGMPLTEACRTLGHKLLGSAVADTRRFPLLIKFIDAHDDLSIQVHPDDHYAALHQQGETGKSEMWYVVAAQPGSRLIAGLKSGTTRDKLVTSLRLNTCLEHMHYLDVQAGDVINIPPGLVHAIGKGILLCEIQQNADTTFRLYDYNRLDNHNQPRPLHIEQALDVIQFDHPSAKLIRGLFFKEGSLIRRHLVLNRYFCVDELSLDGSCSFEHDGSRFSTMTIVDGSGIFSYELEQGHQITEQLFRGDSLLIPAAVRCWTVSGSLRWLSSKPALFSQDVERLNQRMRLEERHDSCFPPRESHVSPVEYAADQSCIALDPKPDSSLGD